MELVLVRKRNVSEVVNYLMSLAIAVIFLILEVYFNMANLNKAHIKSRS